MPHPWGRACPTLLRAAYSHGTARNSKRQHAALSFSRSAAVARRTGDPPPGFGLWLVDAGLLEVAYFHVGQAGRIESAAERRRDLLRRQRRHLGLKRFVEHHGAIELLTACQRGDERRILRTPYHDVRRSA